MKTKSTMAEMNTEVQSVKGQEEEEEMKPWEQHSAVISIPRFDYNAPSSLLLHSFSGFLITSPFKREKSATKEAISILEKCIASNNVDCLEDSDASESGKRRKLCPADEPPTVTSSSELSNDKSPSNDKQTPSLLLVKVTRSGLVLFTFPKGSSSDPVSIVSRVHQSVQSGGLKRPLWCHRILPFQATCRLNEEEISSTVSNLVHKYVDNKSSQLPKPLKFAVGYNRRGIEETEMKAVKGSCSDPNLLVLLDRNKCFSIVAAAVNKVVPDVAVDLNSPELSILIELLPLSGVANGSLVAAVSVLPQHLVSTKPRLCVKPLVSDSKSKKEAP